MMGWLAGFRLLEDGLTAGIVILAMAQLGLAAWAWARGRSDGALRRRARHWAAQAVRTLGLAGLLWGAGIVVTGCPF
ncbi:MAG: hypothetical protein OWV35_06965 [Firmicutes bacterium]|nr:hypothetical protein [Bacillota bacterium]